MGKRIISQRRGRGTFTYRAKGRIEIKLPKREGKAKVIDILHGRNTPIAKIQFEDGSTDYVLASVGLTTNQYLEISAEATPTNGNIVPLSKVPEGREVFFIESKYQDGGKFCKSSELLQL